MKSLRKLVPTDLRDSYQVLKELKDLGNLPPHARLFTADAVSMYTNINTMHGVEVFSSWFHEFSDEIPTNFPVKFFLKVLELVMSGNIFQFDDLYFRQEDGTAMGTSCAMLYACIYYGFHERVTILPQFGSAILFLKRFIDDMLGIWIGTNEQFEEFKRSLFFGKLEWEVSLLSKSIMFLDLEVSIENGKIVTCTYEKPLNKYLYIPPQ